MPTRAFISHTVKKKEEKKGGENSGPRTGGRGDERETPFGALRRTPQ